MWSVSALNKRVVVRVLKQWRKLTYLPTFTLLFFFICLLFFLQTLFAHTIIRWYIVLFFVFVLILFRCVVLVLSEWSNCLIHSDRIFHSWFWVHSICFIKVSSIFLFRFFSVSSFFSFVLVYVVLYIWKRQICWHFSTSPRSNVLFPEMKKKSKKEEEEEERGNRSHFCLSSYCYCLSCCLLRIMLNACVCVCVASTLFANCSWNNTINQCQIFACDKNHAFRFIVTSRNKKQTLGLEKNATLKRN